MLDILFSLAVLLGIAWLGRMLLDARELGWGRLLLAALLGVAIGDSAALFLLAADVSDIPNVDFQQLQVVSFPFRILATMAAIVVLELLFRRNRRSEETQGAQLGPSPSGGSAGPTLFRPAVLARALRVSRILTRHGVAPLVGWGSGRGSLLEANDLARRARMALEEAGGVFIKLGQLLATRPDLLPPAALDELAKLQSSASPVPQAEMEKQVAAQLGKSVAEVFRSVDWRPLGSASMAQAHAAELHDGRAVVIKVRRPRLERVIERDLAILAWLARQAEGRFEWARRLGVRVLAREFAADLRIELDFEVEARRIREVAEAAAAEELIRVPAVIDELTRPGLIVMERLAGTPLANLPGGTSIPRSKALADALCSSQVEAMLGGERFHGDPHAGNVLLLEDGRLGLIDLGISSKLDAFERAAVFQMLLALNQEQPALLLESLITIGAVDQSVHDLDEVERSLARYMAAHLGPGLPPAEAITDLLRLTLVLGLRLPASTSAMFRALSTLMGTLELIHPGYPVIDKVSEIGGDEFRRRLLPGSLLEYVKHEWSEIGPILGRAPRHLDRIAAMVEHGRIATRTRVLADADDRRFLETLFNRFLLTLLSVGGGVVSTVLLGTAGGFEFPWFEVTLYEVLGLVGLFISMTLMFRVLLAVLRSEGARRP